MISESVGNFVKTHEVLSYLVRNSFVSFIWGSKYLDFIPKSFHNSFRNRIHRTRASDFSLKEGLHNISENIQWNTVEDFSELNYPRSFLLMNINQCKEFTNEFQKTMLTGFVLYLHNLSDFPKLFSVEGKVEIDLIYKTMERIENIIKFKQHLCLDGKKSNEDEEFSLADQIDMVMRKKIKIRVTENLTNFFYEKLKLQISMIVTQIRGHWPDTRYDSTNNIW